MPGCFLLYFVCYVLCRDLLSVCHSPASPFQPGNMVGLPLRSSLDFSAAAPAFLSLFTEQRTIGDLLSKEKRLVFEGVFQNSKKTERDPMRAQRVPGLGHLQPTPHTGDGPCPPSPLLISSAFVLDHFSCRLAELGSSLLPKKKIPFAARLNCSLLEILQVCVF